MGRRAEVSSPPKPTATEAELRQADLIRAVADGDQQALAALYDATSRTVYGLLLRILAHAPAAEELFLDVYSLAWRHAAAYSPARGTPFAWPTTIPRSRASQRLRRRLP